MPIIEVIYKGPPYARIRVQGYRCVHGRIHGDPMCTGKSLSTQGFPRFIEIIKQLTSKHEVFRRSWRESRRESRTGSRVQTVFKIQKRSNWNSHLRCLWDYCLLFIKKCRCVLGISTRVRPKHPCKRIWRIHGVAVRPVRAYLCTWPIQSRSKQHWCSYG